MAASAVTGPAAAATTPPARAKDVAIRLIFVFRMGSTLEKTPARRNMAIARCGGGGSPPPRHSGRVVGSGAGRAGENDGALPAAISPFLHGDLHDPEIARVGRAPHLG